jgi:hypothetical protein
LTGAWVVGATPVAAAPALGGAVVLTYPSTVSVGESFSATLTIVNLSLGDAGNASARRVAARDIFHTPSCGSAKARCVGPDPGVFAVTNPQGGLACASIPFTVRPTNPDTGEVEFVARSPIVLGPADGSGPQPNECTITFTVTVLKLPTKNSTPSSATLTTTQLVRASLIGETSRGFSNVFGSNTTIVIAHRD